MENVPTADELLSNNFDGLREIINDDDLFLFYKGVICEFAKEFAKLHVDAALKEASEHSYTNCDEGGELGTVNEDSILNAYPLTNIK